MARLRGILKFVLGDFGPLIVFYAANHFFGLKIAFIASFIFTVAEIMRKIASGEPITLFFKFCATISLVFGAVDLYLQQSFLFKYEATLTNLISAAFFGATIFGDKPIVQEFAEKRMQGKPITPDHVFLFRLWTMVWTAYLALKAAAYAWIASRYTLDQGLLIRMVVGNGSFYALMFASIFLSKPLFMLLKKYRLTPSTRGVARSEPEALAV